MMGNKLMTIKQSAKLMVLWAVLSLQPALAADINQGSLNFVDADIESVIAAIGDYTNTTFIIDPRVKGTINLTSEKPLSKAQAFQLLTSVLRLHGYSVVNANGYSKVVPEADAKLQGGSVQSQNGARGDQIVTQVFHLNYESSANLVNVLRPLISPNNTINANPGNNTLVITDYADNLLRLSKIISALDSPASSELEVVPVRNAIANDIASMVNKLLEPGGAPNDAGRVNLLVDTRSNSIIVRAPSEARANLTKSLIAKLDQPTALPGNVHVVYLKNAEATKLAQTLRAVVSADSSTATLTPATAPQTQQVAISSGGVAGYIQADAATNTLIITANDALYRNLRSIIDQLDARRAQVYIEALIVEVDNSKLAELGVQWAALSGNKTQAGAVTGFSTGGNNLISQAVAKASNSVPLPLTNGLNLGLFSNQLGLGALVHALESDTKSNILSMPNIITLDNEEAKIIVGQNVPFITGQYTTTASGTAGANPFQTVERKDIGLTLRVRPQISEGGTVKMAIYQENSSISQTVNSAGLITNKRSIDTNILVDDGQIIVLGGLIDDNAQDTEEKVPGLGDIPLIGSLFKYRTRSRVKTNLMVFLRPTVIRNNEQSVSLATDRYDYIRNAEVNAQPTKNDLLPNAGAPTLPPLQDGKIDGGQLFNRLENGSLFKNTVTSEPAKSQLR
jgi:general secretion pathway protein D